MCRTHLWNSSHSPGAATLAILNFWGPSQTGETSLTLTPRSFVKQSTHTQLSVTLSSEHEDRVRVWPSSKLEKPVKTPQAARGNTCMQSSDSPLQAQQHGQGVIPVQWRSHLQEGQLVHGAALPMGPFRQALDLQQPTGQWGAGGVKRPDSNHPPFRSSRDL